MPFLYNGVYLQPWTNFSLLCAQSKLLYYSNTLFLRTFTKQRTNKSLNLKLIKRTKKKPSYLFAVTKHNLYGVKEFVCLSVCYQIWPQLSQERQHRMNWKRPDLGSVFRLKSKFWHKNNYPDLHHSQGGTKFATQISPLLNYICFGALI